MLIIYPVTTEQVQLTTTEKKNTFIRNKPGLGIFNEAGSCLLRQTFIPFLAFLPTTVANSGLSHVCYQCADCFVPRYLNVIHVFFNKKLVHKKRVLDW